MTKEKVVLQKTKDRSDCRIYVERETARIPLRWMARSRILVLIDLHFTNEQSRTLDLKPLRWHKMCSSRYTRLADLLFLDTKPIACQDSSCLPRAQISSTSKQSATKTIWDRNMKTRASTAAKRWGCMGHEMEAALAME